MGLFNLYNIYILGNRELIFFLLQSILECIPEQLREKYAMQIDCINNIQWVLGVEVVFSFYDDNCRQYLISDWKDEKVIAKMIIEDKSGKKYRMKIFAVNGRIVSIESTLPFRYLKIDDIQDLQVICEDDQCQNSPK
jgi:hypothetical protein